MFLIRYSSVVLTALALSLPRLAPAQLPHPFAVDAAFGGGNGYGGEFFNNGYAAVRVAVSARALQYNTVSVVADLGYDWLGLGMGEKTVCIPSSRGGCKPSYPDIAGPSGTVGIMVAPSTRIETRLGIGGAAYSVDGTLVGAIVGHVDAAVFPISRLGLVLGGRGVMIPSYRHDRLVTIPLLIGLRAR